MSASTSDKLTSTRNGARPNSARVTTARISGGTSLTCDNLSGWPTSTTSKVHFVTYKIDTNSNPIAGSQMDCYGIVTGTSIGSFTVVDGTDNGHAIGDVVEMLPTAAWGQDLYTWGSAQHSQVDGSHLAVTATSVTASGVINASTQGNLQDGSIALQTIRSATMFDHVASGCVWSGDAYASTRNASMTSGVVLIGGKYVTVSAVTARSFTASKDTYMDVDNTGTITYTEVANNAASPSLAASNIRLGIIVTGASNIAAAGSVNQGQETMVLPIASSIPYTVTDSLGNLICPRDPNRKVLGYRQRTSNFTTVGGPTQVPELVSPVIVPTGRKLKITAFCNKLSNTNAGASNSRITVWDGTVAGTQVGQGEFTSGGANYGATINAESVVTPTATSKTYSVGLSNVGGATATMEASSVAPMFIKVELI